MRDWFKINGIKCTEKGIRMNEAPPTTLPNERITFQTVPGRSGSLTKKEGEDVYDDLVLTATCSMESEERLNEAAAFLRTSGEIEFCTREGGVYYGRVVNQIPLEKIVRGKPNRRFAVNFRVNPFWYKKGEAPTEMTAAGVIINEGNVSSQPVITVYGTGDCTLYINEQLVALTGLGGHVVIDSAIEETYSGTANMNPHMTGDYPRLQPGENEIRWMGNITKIVIDKRTRYL